MSNLKPKLQLIQKLKGKLVFVLSIIFIIVTFTPVLLAKADGLPPAPRNVTLEYQAVEKRLIVNWKPPAKVAGDYTYLIELVNDLDIVVFSTPVPLPEPPPTYISCDNNSCSWANLPTNNYIAKVYTVVETVKSEPAISQALQIHLNTAADQVIFKDISGLPEGVKNTILWAAGFGVSKGYPGDIYEPTILTTRGQMATFFHRLAGYLSSLEPKANDFVDISPLNVHKDDIQWLYNEGITAGYSCTGPGQPIFDCEKAGTKVFNPGGKITRVQTAILLYRFAKSPVLTQAEIDETLAKIKDADKLTNDIEKIAVAFLLKFGISAGYTCTASGNPDPACTQAGDIVFRPANNTPRQQMASLLYKEAVILNILPYLPAESIDPSIFLGIETLERKTITKISFSNNIPICSGSDDAIPLPPDDQGNNNYVCVENNTEVIIGQPGGVIANPNSQYLFSNLDGEHSLAVDFANFDTEYITSMMNMFSNADLRTASFNLPTGFGSAAINMTSMWQDALLPAEFSLPEEFGKSVEVTNNMFKGDKLPDNFSLPVGFGNNLTSVDGMFSNTNLPDNFVLPEGFGSNVFIMNYMFYKAKLNGDIDWSCTDFTNKVVKNKTDYV